MPIKYVEKSCKICNKIFLSKMGLERYCKNLHEKSCVICGSIIEFYGGYAPNTCSKVCATKLRDKTVMDRYGTTNAFNTKYFEHERYVPKKIEISCPLCGTMFIPNGTQKYCRNIHTKACPVCKKEFQYDLSKINTNCCSRKCASEYSRITMSKQKKVCLYCGNEFYSKSSIKKYCDAQHIRFCAVCGKSFPIHPDNSIRTCSQTCRNKLRKLTCNDKYGVDVVSKSDSVKEKLSKAAILSLDKRKQTCMKIYGTENPAQSKVIRDKISVTMASSNSQAKFKSTMQKRYGVDYAAQHKEIRHKQQSHYNIKSSDGITFDSSWECRIYEILLKNNIESETQIPLKFNYNNKDKVTFIDFKIFDRLVEVKGSHLMNGLFRDKTNVPIDVKLKLYRENDVIIITDRNSIPQLQQYDLVGIDYTNCNENTVVTLLRQAINAQSYCFISI